MEDKQAYNVSKVGFIQNFKVKQERSDNSPFIKAKSNSPLQMCFVQENLEHPNS